MASRRQSIHLSFLHNAFLRMVVVVGLLLYSLFLSTNLVTAQTPGPADPKTEDVRISAQVLDNEPPSTPILISPENNSYITTSLVTFVWTGSIDDNGIDFYELSLDGQQYLNHIEARDYETNEFKVVYDESNNKLSLTIKDPLNEGAHTWKIRALDNLGNGTNSATWSFTLDSQAPSFVLTQIGDVLTSISAQDPSTIPTAPIEISINEPQLLGTGESDSSVRMTLTIPDDPTQNYTDGIDVNGNWGHKLGILPRGVVMELDFLITDHAGNISVLNDIQFYIRQQVIVYPPATPSPSAFPSPATSPSPGATPTPSPSTGPGASPPLSPPPTASPPTTPPPSPLISIPFTPPREVAHEIVQETLERLPEPLKALVATIPFPARERITTISRNLAPFSALIIIAAIPLLTIAAIATQFGGNLSLHLLIRILQALGLIPTGKPQGLVYDSKTHKGVPFALITITSQDEEDNDKTENELVTASTVPTTRSIPFIETVITSSEGVYSNVELPPGKYKIHVGHQDYRFPTNRPRPPYLQVGDYYRGEVFTIDQQSKNELLFMIPVDPLHASGERSLKSKLRVSLARMSRYGSFLVLPLFLLTGILTLIFPTAWNWMVFGLYTLMLGRKAIKWFKIPTVTGTVVDMKGKSIENALVRLIDPNTNRLAAVLTTNKDGGFATNISRGKYQLAVTKPRWLWTEGGGTSLYLVDTSLEPKYVVVTMEPMPVAN